MSHISIKESCRNATFFGKDCKNEKLLALAPDVILENMDITEKIMLIRELSLTEEESEQEKKEAIPLEIILKEEGLEELIRIQSYI